MTSLLYKTISLQTVAVKSDPLATVNPSYITSSIKTDDDNTEYMTLSNEEHQVTLVELVPTQDNIAYEQLLVVDNDDYI